MKTAIIASKKDLAGLNIKERLIELFDFKETDEKFDGNLVYQFNDVKLYTVEKDSIECDNIDKEIDCDQIIFITRHRSAEGRNSLSCHVPGNWSEPKLGGFKDKLCIAPSVLMKNSFIELNEQGKDSGYEITLECTHHGPFVEKPVMFIEIGSDEEQWKNKKAAEIIAKTVMASLNGKFDYKVAFGIGGTHYCNNFNKILLRTNIALGHICPKYQLQSLDKQMILQAMEKTDLKPSFVLLDWKGLGKEKQRIVSLLDELGLEYKRTDKLD